MTEARMDTYFRQRLLRRFYCGDRSSLDVPSLPLTELAVDYFHDSVPEKLGHVDMFFASNVIRRNHVSPCSVVLSMLYAKRLRQQRQQQKHLLRAMSSADVFFISMMMASKYLYDEGVDEEVFNDEWADNTSQDVDEVNQMETDFLQAMDWKLFVQPREFEDTLAAIERRLALQEGYKRGWFTYTELDALMDSDLMWTVWDNIGSECSKLLTAICAAYVTSVLSMVGSTALAIHISGQLSSISLAIWTPTVYPQLSSISLAIWTPTVYPQLSSISLAIWTPTVYPQLSSISLAIWTPTVYPQLSSISLAIWTPTVYPQLSADLSSAHVMWVAPAAWLASPQENNEPEVNRSQTWTVEMNTRQLYSHDQHVSLIDGHANGTKESADHYPQENSSPPPTKSSLWILLSQVWAAICIRLRQTHSDKPTACGRESAKRFSVRYGLQLQQQQSNSQQPHAGSTNGRMTDAMSDQANKDTQTQQAVPSTCLDHVSSCSSACCMMTSAELDSSPGAQLLGHSAEVLLPDLPHRPNSGLVPVTAHTENYCCHHNCTRAHVHMQRHLHKIRQDVSVDCQLSTQPLTDDVSVDCQLSTQPLTDDVSVDCQLSTQPLTDDVSVDCQLSTQPLTDDVSVDCQLSTQPLTDDVSVDCQLSTQPLTDDVSVDCQLSTQPLTDDVSVDCQLSTQPLTDDVSVDCQLSTQPLTDDVSVDCQLSTQPLTDDVSVDCQLSTQPLTDDVSVDCQLSTQPLTDDVSVDCQLSTQPLTDDVSVDCQLSTQPLTDDVSVDCQLSPQHQTSSLLAIPIGFVTSVYQSVLIT